MEEKENLPAEQKKKKIQIRCRIVEEEESDCEDNISRSIRPYPEGSGEINISKRSQSLLSDTIVKTVIEAVSNGCASNNLPIDTRLVERYFAENEATSSQKRANKVVPIKSYTVASKDLDPIIIQGFINELEELDWQGKESQISELHVARRTQIAKIEPVESRNQPRSKSTSIWLKQVGFGLVMLALVGAAANSLKTQFGNDRLATVFSNSDTSSTLDVSDLNLNYVKNNAISDLLSFSPNISALALSGETVAVAGENKLLIAKSPAYSDPKIIEVGQKITAIAISDDEDKIAIGDESGKIIIFDRDGKKLAEFDRTYEITSIAFDRDASNIIAGGIAGNLQIFSLTKRIEPRSLLGHSGAINKVIVRGDRIFSASSDYTIRIWNFEGRQLKLLKDNSEVFSLTVKSAENLIYSGNSRGNIREWNLNTGEEIATYSWHKQKVSSLVLIGNLLVSGSNDRNVMLLNTKKRNERITFQDHPSYINTIAASPDGKTIFSASRNSVIVWQNHD